MDGRTRCLCEVSSRSKATRSAAIRRRAGGRLAVLAALTAVCVAAAPAEFSAAAAAFVSQEQVAVGPADTTSPRAALKSFIDACNEMHELITAEHYFDRSSPEHIPTALRVMDCLDMTDIPEYGRLDAAGEIASCLKEILDRVELPRYEEIPDELTIREAGGPESLPRWRIPGTRITIARVEEGPQQHEYLFSPGTVRRAKSYYQELAFLPYRTTGPAVSEGLYHWYLSSPGNPAVAAIVDRLPDWARQQARGLAVWQWIGLVVALLAAILLMAATYKVHAKLARSYRDTALLRYCLTIVLPIVATLIPLVFRHVVHRHLTLRGTPLYYVSFFAYLTALVASLVVVFGVSNRIAAAIIASPHINPQGLHAQFIRIMCKLSAIVASMIVLLEGGRYLGIPITTLIASAGVSGLAVALAAQDAIKNLFGTIMLLSDRPFRAGERIIVGKFDGIVEEIGLRSTRLRLLTGHQATIPNDELSRSQIENVGRRPYIRRIADVRIPLDTPREKLENAVAIVRSALENHEGMDPAFPPRVFFFNFDADAFVIRAIYWYNPPQYWDYLAFSERINFAIYRAFEEQGIQFSLPTRVAHTSIESVEKPVEVNVVDHRQAS